MVSFLYSKCGKQLCQQGVPQSLEVKISHVIIKVMTELEMMRESNKAAWRYKELQHRQQTATDTAAIQNEASPPGVCFGARR